MCIHIVLIQEEKKKKTYSKKSSFSPAPQLPSLLQKQLVLPVSDVFF